MAKKKRDIYQGVCVECHRPFYRVLLGPKDDGSMCRVCYTNKMLGRKNKH